MAMILVGLPAGVIKPPITEPAGIAIIRHLPRLLVPGLGSPFAFSTAMPREANRAQVGMLDMMEDKTAVPQAKPTISFLGDLFAQVMMAPAILVGMVVEAMAVVMDMVPTMKKNTEPPKPLNISLGVMIPINTRSADIKMPTTAMFMVSPTHRTIAARMMPKDCIPARESPSGQGRKDEMIIRAAATAIKMPFLFCLFIFLSP